MQITGFTFISIKQVHGGAASRSKSAMHSMWMSIGGKAAVFGRSVDMILRAGRGLQSEGR